MNSDPKKDYKKYVSCKEEGIRLIQIYSDDWKNKRGIYLDLIKSIGGETKKRIYNLSAMEITHKEAQDFLNDNHYLSGAKVSGSLYIGLFSKGKIYCVSVFKRRRDGEYEWVRHAFKIGHKGWNPAKKCLDFFIKKYPSKIVTFSDNRIHTGKMYERLGFKLEKELKPDYEYSDRSNRKHKFNFRVKAGIDEKEEAAKKGFYRIWDSGKKKWVLEI